MSNKPNTGATVEACLNPYWMTSDDYKAFAPTFAPSRFQKSKDRMAQVMITCLGIPVEAAKVIAHQAAEDVSLALKHTQADFKIGKQAKDGTLTIGEIAEKVKGINQTRPLSIAVACQIIDSMSKGPISFGHTGWCLNPGLQEYVNAVIETGLANPDAETVTKPALVPA